MTTTTDKAAHHEFAQQHIPVARVHQVVITACLILWQSAVHWATSLNGHQTFQLSMKQSAKAVLLSGLVFPGLGHIYLKRFALGTILMLIAIIATGYIIVDAVHVALIVSDKIAAGTIPLDVTAISNLITRQSQQVVVSSSIAAYMLGAAWLIGMVDSYRIGIALERNKETSIQK